jgi:hypothetical protein
MMSDTHFYEPKDGHRLRHDPFLPFRGILQQSPR